MWVQISQVQKMSIEIQELIVMMIFYEMYLSQKAMKT